MTLHIAPTSLAQPLDAAAGQALLRRVGERVAPLWPLETFVAVNPYHGLLDRTFDEGAAQLALTAGARSTMGIRFYRSALATGDITDDDIDQALARKGGALSRGDIDRALALDAAAAPQALASYGECMEQECKIPVADYVTDCISRFCAHIFDAGQAYYAPFAQDRADLWQAFLVFARHDRSLAAQGLGALHRQFASLPADPVAACQHMLAALDVPAGSAELYLERLLRSVGGWAAYARQQSWLADDQRDTAQRPVEALVVIRLAYDWALQQTDNGRHLDALHRGLRAALHSAHPVDPAQLVLQEAYELAAQRRLIARFAEPQAQIYQVRPDVQIAFCIDVRSEIIRRAVEQTVCGVETIGFAGFFGLPVDFKPLGAASARAQCPVLLKPSHSIEETVADNAEDMQKQQAAAARRRRRARLLRAMKRFSGSAVSSFAFVETLGLAFGVRLISSMLGFSRPAPEPRRFGLRKRTRLRPRIAPAGGATNMTGIAEADRLALAQGALRGMGLTQDFAPVVLLLGHGSASTNNPHAAGLDCGACGGHAGDVNARLVADILNDAAVRRGLAAAGISIPEATRFIAGLHNTTTDDISLFCEDMPLCTAQAERLEKLQDQLARAAEQARAERASALGLDVAGKAELARAYKARTQDWSQVRPEWGLAGCQSFIAAPRHRTRGQALQGRSFLHSYDWRSDSDFSILELIMTAPMVVASWINLQYYASTVDNRVFGSGNKTLHNVVGQVGVLEGNGGDLRSGLALQALHDGENLIHKPNRLSVVIEAPQEAMNTVIEAHEGVRQLLDHQWIYLFQMDDSGRIGARYEGRGQWTPCSGSQADIFQDTRQSA